MNLHELVETGDIAGLRKAAAHGADMNTSFPDSDECLLSAAAAKGNLKLVKLLLTLGANPNHRETVTPPLAAAAAGGSVECVRAIIDAGADIDVRDEDGATPLMVAAASGSLAIVKLLVESGANVKLKDLRGNTSLSAAAAKYYKSICEFLMPLSTAKDCDKARIALEFNSHGRSKEEVDRLIMAATQGQRELVREIIEKGVPADAINGDGKTALMRAANKDHIEIVRWLLEQDANVNRQDIYGECPLTYAAMGCHPEMYEFLYSLTDKKLRKRAEKIKKNQIEIGNWPSAANG